MAVELRELRNNVSIIGTLKTIKLEEKQTKKGKDAIMGHLVVEVIDGDKVNNIRINVFANKFKANGEISKLYKSDKTVMDEFKSIDVVGREQADFISVTGNLDGNDYPDANGVLRSSTQVRGVFFNREEKGSATPHAWATVETVVNGMTDIENEDGPTGEKSVEAYTVGYNATPIELQNVTIGADIAEAFSSMYFPGTTGLITYKINNYTEIKNEAPTEAETQGFGSTARVEDSAVGNYVSSLEIIGGEQPVDNGTEFTPEMIDELLKLRQQQKTLASQQQTQSQPKQGFGDDGGRDKVSDPFANSSANSGDDFDAF